MSEVDENRDSVSRCPVRFDQHGPEYAARSHETFAEMREECPVLWSDAHGGFYYVTRYEDVAQIARDDVRFSSDWTPDGKTGVSIPPTRHRTGFIEMDPPRSTEFKRAASLLLSPRAVESVLPLVRAAVTEAIDDFVERGRCELILDFTSRVPGSLTMRLFGLPAEDWRHFADYFHGLTSEALAKSTDGDVGHGSDNPVLVRMRTEIALRRKNPLDDGITRFIDQPIDGQVMDDEEAAQSLLLLFLGGFDTTSGLLSNAFLWLYQNPAVRDHLRLHPEAIPMAVEEFLRYFTPVQNLARTVRVPAVVGGTALAEGDRVHLSWASANLDERKFEAAEEIRIDRVPNPHQAFGLGSHRCVGSHLARAEAAIAIEQLLTRLPDYRVEVDQAVRYASIGQNNGWRSMPIAFTPGPRIG